MKCIT
jgi:hypothetical protein